MGGEGAAVAWMVLYAYLGLVGVALVVSVALAASKRRLIAWTPLVLCLLLPGGIALLFGSAWGALAILLLVLWFVVAWPSRPIPETADGAEVHDG